MPPLVVSDEGPIMTPWICRAALQRSVGKIFYQAGFEEFQPSALECMTDVVGRYFSDLISTMGTYTEAPKIPVPIQQLAAISTKAGEIPRTAPPLIETVSHVPIKFKPRFSREAAILHTLSLIHI